MPSRPIQPVRPCPRRRILWAAPSGLAVATAIAVAFVGPSQQASGQPPAERRSRILLPIGLNAAPIPRALVPTAQPPAGITPATPPFTATPTSAPPSTPAVPPPSPPDDPLLAPLSPRHLRLALGETDPGASPRADDWWIDSADDPAYAEARQPRAVAARASAAALVPQGWPFPAITAHELLVELPSRLVAGRSYRLGQVSSGQTWTLMNDVDRVRTPTLHLNSVGYRPGVPAAPGHYAYVSAWLAGLSPLELADSERDFAVVDASSGAVVHRGRLALSLAHDEAIEDAYDTNYTMANVYQAELGALPPGDYYLRWEGVGRSHLFEVGDPVLDEAFEAVFRGLYHQRCGTALDAHITDWPHEICHTAPVELTDADIHVTGSDAFAALPALATGETVDVRGGYHDAGDYDRRASHLQVVDALVDLFELVPWLAARDDLGIPESGNGRADLLDEALWALDLYAQLQGAGGGIRAGIETTGYPEWGMMPEEDVATRWYAYAEDPRSSYRFAGAATKLARALEPEEPALAAQWQQRAESAWTWAEANPRETYDASTLGAYAAAELLKTSGEPRFEAALVAHAPLVDEPDAGLPPWDPGGLMPALWALATAEGASAARRANGARAFRSRVDTLLEWYPRSGHRWTKHPYAPVGYGTLTTPAQATWLLRAHHLPQPERGADAADLLALGAQALDYQLGANPSGRSWVTGLGETAVRHPLHNPSMGDGIAVPVPGIPVYGPSHEIESDGILGSALGAFRPPADEWPLAERFVDVGYVPIYNEFTVAESMAPSIFVMGYLAGVDR